MNTRIKSLSAFGLLLILVSDIAFAGTNGYLLNCFCAKSYARGGTVVAIPDNSSVILSNPAGLAFIPQRAVGVGGSVDQLQENLIVTSLSIAL